jgi:hypothetical protein
LGLRAAALLQTLFVLFAALAFLRVLDREFAFSRPLFYLAGFVLALPLLPFDPGHGWAGNFLLSEALLYGLFLICMSFFALSLFKPSRERVLLFLGSCGLCVLARPQFAFLYAGAAVFLIYLSARNSIRKTAPLALALAAVIAVCGIFDRTYHYFSGGVFMPTAGRNCNLAANLLYLSDSSDALLFGEDDAHFMEKTYQCLESEKALAKYRHETGLPLASLHTPNYNTLIWVCWSKTFFKETAESAFVAQGQQDFEEASGRVVSALWGKYRGAYARLVVLKLLDRWTVFEWIGLLLVLTLPFWPGAGAASALLAFAALFHVFNVAAVSLLAAMHERYFFPTEIFALLAFMVFLWKTAWKKPG